MQPARLRCDPTDYAKRQQEKKNRAKEIREQRHRGVFSDEHTFSPKVNSRPRSNTSLPAPREEFDCNLKSDSMATQNYGRNNNRQDIEDPNSYGNDALDNLSRRYPKKTTASQQQTTPFEAPLEPEHDTLFREVKRATGREIEDLPIKKPLASTQLRSYTGPCLRNSSCGCPRCRSGGVVPSNPTRHAPEPTIRLSESRAMPSQNPNRLNNSSRTSEMGNSLMLLKSKMSRRKARSAPTTQASLFVEKNVPSAVVHSARLPPCQAMSRDASSPPSRQTWTSGQVVAQNSISDFQHNVENKPNESNKYPAAITSGFNLSEQLENYAVDPEQMEQCQNCNRKFNSESFQKHQRICAKVFSAQRKVFNMTAKRLQGTAAEKIAKEAKAKNSGGGDRKGLTEQPIKVKSAADWKQKSDMFRNAMKASRDVTKALKEGKELPPVVPSAPDPSLIQCEYCSRRFNEKAAERHINFCREKSQRDSIKSTGRKTPAVKPGSRVAVARKR